MENRDLYCDFTFSQFRDSETFRDMQGLVGVLNPAENMVHAWRMRVRFADELAYDIWIHVYDLAFYPSFDTTKGLPRFIYEADVFIQRDSKDGPSVNLKYAVKSPKEATETAHAVWYALDCPTHT